MLIVTKDKIYEQYNNHRRIFHLKTAMIKSLTSALHILFPLNNLNLSHCYLNRCNVKQNTALKFSCRFDSNKVYLCLVISSLGISRILF